MAVVYIEKRSEVSDVDGKKVTRYITDEKVINDATIQGVFGNAFRISGMTAGESRDLSLLLRAGSLSVPIYPVDERTIGPSLGKENIQRGRDALLIGMGAVFVFMVLYYHVFGLVADVVLLANVVLLTALYSLFGGVLTLPGIAGIILTVGVAVDANVLIYERIREELRNGVSPQAAIRAGFDKAFSAIADSNVTTIIAGPGAVGVRHGAGARLCRGAGAGYCHFDVHIADGQPRTDHSHVRRSAQARPPSHLSAGRFEDSKWNFFTSRPISRSWPPARCGTGCPSAWSLLPSGCLPPAD